jgi:hypothetical protein
MAVVESGNMMICANGKYPFDSSITSPHNFIDWAVKLAGKSNNMKDNHFIQDGTVKVNNMKRKWLL